MIVFPNAKINLGLNVIEKRPDGYHNIETVFLPIGLSDVQEIIESENGIHEFKTTGINVEGVPSNNLCVKAYQLLKDNFSIPVCKIHLHKVIPIGAGLGGGSADAAFMLKELNQKFNLELSKEQLMHIALQLGSDCPYFIINTPCFAQGRGEILTPLELNLKGYFLVLINPGIKISTAEAYSGIIPEKPAVPIKDVINLPIEIWKNNLFNDFEKTIFQLHPEIAELKKQLYNLGAVYASMSGSGSSVYGIFHEKIELSDLFAGYFSWSGELL